MAELETRRRPHRIVSAWFREESFWRDVTTRTVAILVSGAVIYVFALFIGFIGAPSAESLSTLPVFFGVGGAGLLVCRLAVRSMPESRHRWWIAVPLYAFTVLYVLLLAFSLLGLIAYISPWASAS